MFNVFRGRRGDSEGEPDRFTMCQKNKVIWQRFGGSGARQQSRARAGSVSLDLAHPDWTGFLGGDGIGKHRLLLWLPGQKNQLHPLSPSSSSRCSASHYPLQWIRWVWGEGKRFSLEQTHKKEWIPNTGKFLQHLAAGQCQHLGMRARDSLGSTTGHLETPTPTIKSLYCGI